MGQWIVHVQVADLCESFIPHRVFLGKQKTEELEKQKEFEMNKKSAICS